MRAFEDFMVGEVMLFGPVTATVDDIKSFASLQQRLGRKVLTPKILKELPVALIAYDLLEQDGVDIRHRPQRARRRRESMSEPRLTSSAPCAIANGAPRVPQTG